MKKFLIFTLFVACICLNAAAQQYRMKYSANDGRPLSLENVIRLYLENSYEVLLIEQDLVIAQQRIQ